jgi:hypothetical protein
LPAFLVGPLSIPARPSGHAAHWFSLREFVVVLIVVALIIILLAGPVAAGALREVASEAGKRAVPGTFFTGLGVFFIGIIVGVRIIDFIGLGLIGAVVLGVILDNYLGEIRRGRPARPARRRQPGPPWPSALDPGSSPWCWW